MPDSSKNGKSSRLGIGIAVGIAIGSGLGVAFGNIALGMGCGIAIGVAIGVALSGGNGSTGVESRKSGDDDAGAGGA